jgi:Histidine kinase-, DNA gyrase B-, and HSP90-like ATPase
MTKFRSSYQRHGFGIKVLLAALIVAAGDILFYQHWITGANFGLFALCWLFGLLAARPGMWRSKPAMISAGFAALFGAALIIYPTLLAWALFWCAISMAALLPATARFDDGWRWFQRLSLHAMRALFAPMIDAIKFMRIKRRKPRANMRKILPNLVLPVAGGVIIILGLAGQDAAVLCPQSTIIAIATALLENSRQAGADTVRISSSRFKDLVHIDFADNGPGISLGDRGRVFDPFFTSKRSDGGTGLGLAIALALVQASKGSLELLDTGEGASFRLTLRSYNSAKL